MLTTDQLLSEIVTQMRGNPQGHMPYETAHIAAFNALPFVQGAFSFLQGPSKPLGTNPSISIATVCRQYMLAAHATNSNTERATYCLKLAKLVLLLLVLNTVNNLKSVAEFKRQLQEIHEVVGENLSPEPATEADIELCWRLMLSLLVRYVQAIREEKAIAMDITGIEQRSECIEVIQLLLRLNLYFRNLP